jgi:hypothetical protein
MDANLNLDQEVAVYHRRAVVAVQPGLMAWAA